MTDYLAYGQKLFDESPQSHVLDAMIDGHRIWFKRATPPKARLWHAIQKLLATILRNPILRPTVSAGGAVTLGQEAARMIFFKENSVHVPTILASNSEIIAMSDLGPPFPQILGQTESPKNRLDLLKQAIAALARLHSAGLVHGRPYLRDMTWDGKQTGFLDLEENPLSAMPLPTAQARDVWIFLSSASQYARRKDNRKIYDSTIIRDLYGEYIRQTSPETLSLILPELRRFVFLLRPLRKILDHSFVLDRIGNDARRAVYINRCLEECLE